MPPIFLPQKTHPEPVDTEKVVKDDEPAPLSYSPFVLFPPAMFDIAGTSVMYVALTLTSASSFQVPILPKVTNISVQIHICLYNYL
jgi:hypothetical protein